MRSVLAAALLVVAACSSQSVEPRSVQSTVRTTQPGPTSSQAEAELDWFLNVLNGAPVSEADFDTHFAEVFRDAVPYDQFVGLTSQLQTAAPYAVVDVELGSPPDGLTATIRGVDGVVSAITLHLDSDSRMDGLFVGPGEPPELRDPPASVEAGFEKLSQEGRLRVVAASVGPDGCEPINGRGLHQLMPLGSVFKLYVLAAVIDAVEAGTMSWDDDITITNARKSLPSGILQLRDEGDTVSVVEAAELMISISDNTATDLLMHTVGRAAVEAAVANYGHSDPDVLRPFPTTREFFALKLAATDEERQDWIVADEAARRTMLDDLGARSLDEVDLTRLAGDPLLPDQIEWFATPMDVCRVLAAIMATIDEGDVEPIRSIMTTNAGIDPEPGRWIHLAFKGGSEPGLVALAWYMQDSGGRRWVLAGSVLDPNARVDDNRIAQLAAAVRDLLGA